MFTRSPRVLVAHSGCVHSHPPPASSQAEAICRVNFDDVNQLLARFFHGMNIRLIGPWPGGEYAVADVCRATCGQLNVGNCVVKPPVSPPMPPSPPLPPQKPPFPIEPPEPPLPPPPHRPEVPPLPAGPPAVPPHPPTPPRTTPDEPPPPPWPVKPPPSSPPPLRPPAPPSPAAPPSFTTALDGPHLEQRVAESATPTIYLLPSMSYELLLPLNLSARRTKLVSSAEGATIGWTTGVCEGYRHRPHSMISMVQRELDRSTTLEMANVHLRGGCARLGPALFVEQSGINFPRTQIWLTNLTISDMVATDSLGRYISGAMDIRMADAQFHGVTVVNCTGRGDFVRSAAMYMMHSSLVAIESRFHHLAVKAHLVGSGCAIDVDQSSVLLLRCVIESCSSCIHCTLEIAELAAGESLINQGGAIFVENVSTLIFRESRISNCEAYGAAASGAGIAAQNSYLRFWESQLVNCRAVATFRAVGGAVHAGACIIEAEGLTIARCSAQCSGNAASADKSLIIGLLFRVSSNSSVPPGGNRERTVVFLMSCV